MKVTFLGTGTSQGVPVIACPCEVCTSPDEKDKRLRTSALIEFEGHQVVIDAGPDFRTQMLRENVKTLDAILLTHAHKDHTAGLDDIRAFNYFQKKPMDVYATSKVQDALHVEYHYAFDKKADYPGIPRINFKTVDSRSFFVKSLEVVPVEVFHFKLPVLGYRFGGFTYITDANLIHEKEKEKIKGTRILVLNALRKEKHISHFSLEEAISLAKEIGAEKTYLTHISHQLGLHNETSASLPPGIYLAYDGLKLEL
ncbi:MAG: MBL fold metallo-hydrolase [Chitinophagales bacterium]|nr:MBL fold metallo-hydrolase [Chitinophagales bacterium]